MLEVGFVRLPPRDWPSIAEFIFEHNKRPSGGVHCLHAAQGLTVASHAAELAALAPAEAAFWDIRAGEQRVGILGCEFDVASRRAWMRGPITSDESVLRGTAHAVGPTLEAALPEVIEFNAFPAADDVPLNEWYAAAGYAPLQLHTVMRADIERLPKDEADVRPATKDDLPIVSRLHHRLFPSPYIGDADLDRAVEGDGACALFVVCGDEGKVEGYLYVQDNPSEQEAYVDYLGVAESHRGQGLGRALLNAAAQWGALHGRRHLALTVREDRSSALNLYRRAGFVEISAGRHWRKVLDPHRS